MLQGNFATFQIFQKKNKNSQFYKKYVNFHKVHPRNLEAPDKRIMLLRAEIAALFNITMAPKNLSKRMCFFVCVPDLSNLTSRFFFIFFLFLVYDSQKRISLRIGPYAHSQKCVKHPKHSTQFQRYINGVSWNETALCEIRKRLTDPNYCMLKYF